MKGDWNIYELFAVNAPIIRWSIHPRTSTFKHDTFQDQIALVNQYIYVVPDEARWL